MSNEFEEFWLAFPHKVGKFYAAKCFEKARKVASQEEIIAGVERYKRTKPRERPWCNPSTFLNQGRWTDEADEEAKPKSAMDIFGETINVIGSRNEKITRH